MKNNSRFYSVVVLLSFLISISNAQILPDFPVKSKESAETWRSGGWEAIKKRKSEKIRTGKAKNVILFIGDGMGISTLTAARILEGQQRKESGEENSLSFENFPFSALSKTYSVNQQTSDSAPTMSAIITGVKTEDSVLSVNQEVIRRDYTTVEKNKTETLLEKAEVAGKSTGIVSTARITHATPAACYAHTAERDWESDTNICKGDSSKKDACDAKFPDIARQLIEFEYGKGKGKGLEVMLGGGRREFLPNNVPDPEYEDENGKRSDDKNLPDIWEKQEGEKNKKKRKYVWNKADFDKVKPDDIDQLLGLFEPSHMKFDCEPSPCKADKSSSYDEPSLTDMTTKAIDILKKNKNGFFLMVEAGRIDHGHHDGNAYRALTETIELSNAVRATMGKVNLDETLIIVTADHSHTFNMLGYPTRGNNILGLVREVDENGNIESEYKKDALGLPFTTLNYTNGRGFIGKTDLFPEGPKFYHVEPKNFKPKQIMNGRPDLTKVETTNPDYLQEAMIPLKSETHGGEDVAIFAMGANAHLIRGSMEQNWIFYVMHDAFRFKK